MKLWLLPLPQSQSPPNNKEKCSHSSPRVHASRELRLLLCLRVLPDVDRRLPLGLSLIGLPHSKGSPLRLWRLPSRKPAPSSSRRLHLQLDQRRFGRRRASQDPHS